MNRFANLIFSLLIALIVADAQGQSTAPNDLPADEQLAVMHNGRVYIGDVAIEDGIFVVHSKNGFKVRLQNREIDFIANSRRNAYLTLRDRAQADNVSEQFKLAEWSVKYADIQSAHEQIEYLSLLSNNAAGLDSLRNQLQAMQASAMQASALNLAVASSRPDTRTVNHTLSNTHGFSHQNADLLIASMPATTSSRFSTAIEIKLLNGCAAAACHGPSTTTSFRLWGNRASGLNTTSGKRNLFEVMQWVDRSQPDKSVLFDYLATVHGGAVNPPFATTPEHREVIRNWVLSTASGTFATTDSGVRPVNFESPDARPQQVVHPTVPERAPIHPTPVNLLSPRASFTPQDEFDPQIFNRQYGNADQAFRGKNPYSARAASALQPIRPSGNENQLIPAVLSPLVKPIGEQQNYHPFAPLPINAQAPTQKDLKATAAPKKPNSNRRITQLPKVESASQKK